MDKKRSLKCQFHLNGFLIDYTSNINIFNLSIGALFSDNLPLRQQEKIELRFFSSFFKDVMGVLEKFSFFFCEIGDNYEVLDLRHDGKLSKI